MRTENFPRKITIVAHGLRTGGGISVGLNAIENLLAFYPQSSFQIFIPDLAVYREVMQQHTTQQWIVYRERSGLAGRWLYDEFYLPALINQFAPGVVLCLGNVAVRSRHLRQILLIHDPHYFYPVIHYERESIPQKIVCRLKRNRFRKDLRHVSVLLCQTQSAAIRVKAASRFDGQIMLLPNAISVHSLKGAAETNHCPGITQDGAFNLFYLTRYYPHKNLEILVDLFCKYRKELAQVRLYLTIAAEQHPGAKRLLAAIEKHGLQNNIINLGPIPQVEIAAHFRAVDAMIMPTTLESFSGSYLEAMTFGCPILTSDLDFAHEVCKDAALYFDPWSVDSIYQQLHHLIYDPDLRHSIAERGLELSRRTPTGWEENARTLATAFQKAMS